MYNITAIPGDGIGPEVMEGAMYVLDNLRIKIKWDIVNAGASVVQEKGRPLPDEVLQSITTNRVVLKGPITTPVGKDFRSINVELRKRFKLYANVRPVISIPGVKSRYSGIDVVIIRENTQGLYTGIEYKTDRDTAHALKLITREASERIVQFAFVYAKKHHRKRVTCFHKANIMKLTDGLFLESARQVARRYPDLEYQELIVDNGCMQMVINPEKFDVLVMPNLYGDIMSDMCAGLVGGLGLVPGANIGKDAAIFEAVHGSAPDLAGRNTANPTALILTSALMLDYLGEKDKAEILRKAVFRVIKEGIYVTPDLLGSASTLGMAEEVVKYINL
ncbi:MAG: isocitrate/isopropylmalate family dehydrogenase [Halanaerobiales bacterium]|nr:isocitrate/isopropylmalate family dehydrogenase [Halanaerobiales bacterium]